MNIIKKLSNFHNNLEGGAQSNRLNNTNIREVVKLWTSGINEDRIRVTRQYGDISTWDVSIVTDMSKLFSLIYDFNEDISNWDVSNVTNMQEMFSRASSFNQPLERWNVSNVTNMDDMFLNAFTFNQPLEQWNVSNVITMQAMFEEASSFNQPIGRWNVGNVTNMASMFLGARSFNEPIDGWNVSNVTNMRSMFNEASVFNQDIGNWNVSNVNDMELMFYRASAFDQDIRHWDIRNVSYFNGMFDDATAFIERFLENLPEALDDPMYIFVDLNNQTIRTAVSLWFDNRDEAIRRVGEISRWNVSNVTNMNGLFSNRSDFNDNISQWNVRNVTDMETMFLHASAFNQPLGQWNVDNVTLMGGMFAYASAFNQPLEQWNVGNVTDMEGMFLNASTFNQPLEQWNVSNVTTMNVMFNGASAFNQTYPEAEENPRSVFTSSGTNTQISRTLSDTTYFNPQMNLMGQFNDSYNDSEACPMSDIPKEGDYVEVKNIVLVDPSTIQDSRDLLYNKTIQGIYISENRIRILDDDHDNNFIRKDIQIYPNPINGAIYTIIKKYDYLKDEHVRFINTKLKNNPSDKIVKYHQDWQIHDPQTTPKIKIGYVDNNTVTKTPKRDDTGNIIKGIDGNVVQEEKIVSRDRLYNYADFIRFFIKENIHMNNIPLFVLKFEGQQGEDYSGLFKSFLADFVKSISGHNNVQKNFMTTSDKDCLKFNKDFNKDINNEELNMETIKIYINNHISNLASLNLETSNYINKILYSYFTGSFLSRIITLEPHDNVSDYFSPYLFIPNFTLDPYILLSLKNYSTNLIKYNNSKISLNTEFDSQMEFIKYFSDNKKFDLQPQELTKLQNQIREILFAKDKLGILFPSDIYTIEEIYEIYSKIPERSILINSKSFEILQLYQIDNKDEWDTLWTDKKYSYFVREIFSGFTDKIILPNNSIEDINYLYVDEKLFKIEYENKDLFIKTLLRNEFENILDGTALSLLFLIHGFFSSYYGVSDKIKNIHREFLQILFNESQNSQGLKLDVKNIDKFVYRNYVNDPINGFELDELDELFSGPKKIDREKLKESIKITYMEVPEDKMNDQFYKDLINKFIDDSDENKLRLMLKYITGFYTQITNEIIFNIMRRSTYYDEDNSLWYTSYDGLSAHTCFSTVDVDYRIFEESEYKFSDNDAERETQMKKHLDELNDSSEEVAKKIELNIWLSTFNIKKTLFDENWLSYNSFTMAGGGNNELITSLNNFIN